MANRFLNIFKNVDWLLLVAVFLLICFGLSTLYSLTLGTEGSGFNFLQKQFLFSLLGFILLLFFVFLDYRLWRSWSGWLYISSLLLLTLVLFFGKTIQGTTGWFRFLGFSFQPVELAKIAVVIFLAKFFSEGTYLKKEISLWLRSFLIILPACLLVILQPDFGSMIVVFCIWLSMIWLSGAKRKYFIGLFLIILVVAIIGWQFFLQTYQKERILTFLNPTADVLGSGYNVQQSIIALGSGGLTGKGLGLGTQSQLHFLPVSEADFIFAVLGEELGFIGTSLIFILYLVVFYRLFKIVQKVKDDFGAFMVLGFATLFLVQIIINIGMAVGLLPVTGLPLPFVSYGGSFLVMSLIAMGIIQSVKIRS
ncbi:MAG TPA: rod shape-determining protein RodA [bacterium]|nr:rod shape-determining protein RodA [bacterium]